jgi:hypothetical protein
MFFFINFLFLKEQKIFNSNSIARCHKLIRRSDSVRAIKENIASIHLKSKDRPIDCSLDGDILAKLNENLKYFGRSPFNYSAEDLKSEELGYACAVIDLIFQFDKNSQNHQSIIDSRRELGTDLKDLLSLLQDSIKVDLSTKEVFYSLKFEAKRNLRRLSLDSKVALGKFLKSALVISAIGNCYATLNVFFISDNNEGIMLQILPFGVYVNRELSDMVFLVYYDSNSDVSSLRNFKFEQFESLDVLNKVLESNIDKPARELFEKKEITQHECEDKDSKFVLK